MPSQRLEFKLSRAQLAALDEGCAHLDISRAEFIRASIEVYLDFECKLPWPDDMLPAGFLVGKQRNDPRFQRKGREDE